jgi:hypothetical protein
VPHPGLLVQQDPGDEQLLSNIEAIKAWSTNTGRDALRVRPPRAADPTVLKAANKWLEAPVMSALAERALHKGVHKTHTTRGVYH